MSFGVLALIVLAGLAGPLLGVSRRWGAPLLVGEVLAGVMIGTTGFGWIDASEPTVSFLAQIGFAMLMLAAGMHVPVRTPGLLRRLPHAAVGVAIAAVLATPVGVLAAQIAGGEHAAVYALLLSGGSAAVVLPALVEHHMITSKRAQALVMQISLADVLAIVAVPLVLEPDRALRAGLAGVAVAACAGLVYAGARMIDDRPAIRTIRRASKERGWALDLRAALLVLFTLGWIAIESGTSLLVAGFSAGLVVGALGGPKRLSRQVTGIGEGFFVPLFFVVLGARIDLAALWSDRALLSLVAILVIGNVVVHLASVLVTGQGWAAGLIMTAQLGLPAAIADLGLRTDVLSAGQAAAVVAAGLCSLPLTAIGVRYFVSGPAGGPRAHGRLSSEQTFADRQPLE